MTEAEMKSNGLGDASIATIATEAATCEVGSDCCQGDSSMSHPHSSTESAPGTDGAGEPCPTPIMWQEICEHYYRDSVPWEITHGPHQIEGRTWGQGQPLYLLNNFAATAEMYALVAWLLRDEYRCVLFDIRACDRISARRTRPTMPDFAADVMTVADAQGDDQFLVFGAGFGAGMALQAALDHPTRIGGMILQHAFAKRRLSFFERLLARFCRRSGRNLDQLPQRRRFQAVNHQPWFPPFDSSRFEFLVESTGQLPLCDLGRRALAVDQFDVSGRLNEIQCPVMLLRTEGEGRLAADSQAELEKLFNQPRVEWMHSAGQHPCLTHPHRVAKLVRSFFPAPANSNQT